MVFGKKRSPLPYDPFAWKLMKQKQETEERRQQDAINNGAADRKEYVDRMIAEAAAKIEKEELLTSRQVGALQEAWKTRPDLWDTVRDLTGKAFEYYQKYGAGTDRPIDNHDRFIKAKISRLYRIIFLKMRSLQPGRLFNYDTVKDPEGNHRKWRAVPKKTFATWKY